MIGESFFTVDSRKFENLMKTKPLSIDDMFIILFTHKGPMDGTYSSNLDIDNFSPQSFEFEHDICFCLRHNRDCVFVQALDFLYFAL